MRPIFEWNIGQRTLLLGKRTLIMGIVNVTPDSFSDGGLYLDPKAAVGHAQKLLDDGVDIIDVGGESTRPGANINVAKVNVAPTSTENAHSGSPVKIRVGDEEELARVIPVIVDLKIRRPDCIISIDTYKASVARKAVEAGAEIVNDVSGFRWDPQMLKTLASMKCGAILMHSRGRPEEWSLQPPASDIVVQVKRELREWVDIALTSGVKRERIVLDPGFGFGKNYEENYPLLKRFREFHELRYPLAAGVSRKSFVGRAIARHGKDASILDRTYGTVAAETALVMNGAHVIRTHDVKAAFEAARVADLSAS